jgi:lipoprotein-releasing system permease protein
VTSTFELFIASRYLRARRKHTLVSAITVISVIGVAAGVMALVIAMAVTTGMRNSLQRSLLGAMAHINVVPKVPGEGIDDWRGLMAKLRQSPHVKAAAPELYSPFMVTSAQSAIGVVKGIDVNSELAVSETLRHLKAGSLDALRDPTAKPPGLIVGARMAEEGAIRINNHVHVISPEGGGLTPWGNIPKLMEFRVVGIFESGFYDFDEHYAFTSIPAVQRMLGLGDEDQVNDIALMVDDLNRAPQIAKELEKSLGTRYTATAWQEQNSKLFSALAGEQMVSMIVIGLIELVAALNILIVLVMMVMEKYRDIAVLMSMGARRQQIRKIFMLQGVLIGVVGSAIGLAVGYPLCYLADKYHWIRIDESVYAFSYVPFEAHWVHGIWIAAVAITISFLATLYPAKNATQIAPAEVLRYE